jgi:hypothetical protein
MSKKNTSFALQNKIYRKMRKLFIFLTITIHFSTGSQELDRLWESPPEEARPWTFWYWMQGAVSKEGITADLEAMKEAGLAGAYLMPIRGAPEKPFVTPAAEQLSPLWREMVKTAFAEADRLGLKLGFHVCDGFALAGGPWITPELSMQKVVWSKISVKGGGYVSDTLPVPENYAGYYRDIATFALKMPAGVEDSDSRRVKPEVSCSIEGVDASFLADNPGDRVFRCDSVCRIKYAFEKPFTLRSVQIEPSGNNIQSQRFVISASDDDITYHETARLEPPRQGWQNDGFAMTHSIASTTARYFRFDYDRAGSEPGAEDLDAAKWRPSLKIKGIYLSSEPRIHQFEGKNGSVWRISPRTSESRIPDSLCIQPDEIIDISDHVDENGRMDIRLPEGNWMILRMGHTSTGHTNATGGGGAGLECDKFNPEAVRLQFDSWFGKVWETAGEERARRVLSVFHVDSWECGSQNWSPVFREEFSRRRGYDILKYLPLYAGIPVESAETSERILHDVRETVSELITDNFYGTLKSLSGAKGCTFSAECVAPTMTGDGMMHFRNTDIPMGEYWFESPTHDKPNDVLDAVSAAHIYGKNIVQAEAFTQLRMTFTEHPALLKTLQDRHYALGINRLSYHVFVHNPWLDRRPGMTLDGIGLFFQRDQTWWRTGGRAWTDYAARCQALLQFGKPVADIAVFTGEDIPRRAVLPDRLVPFLPGLFGREKVEREQARLANAGEPLREMPAGVTHSANITDAKDWVNALRGYQYDSFNPDVLLHSMDVENGNIVLKSGMTYRVLVVPGSRRMNPEAGRLSVEVMEKLEALRQKGAKIFFGETPSAGKFLPLPFGDGTLDGPGIERDFTAEEKGVPGYAKDIAYTHRQGEGIDIYFVSNQRDSIRDVKISMRVADKIPEIRYPVSGLIETDFDRKTVNGRTEIDLTMQAGESLFVVFQTPANKTSNRANPVRTSVSKPITGPWSVTFDRHFGGPSAPAIFDRLTDWSENGNDSIRFYSGTAVYSNSFDFTVYPDEKYFIEPEDIAVVAAVKINGIPCGTLWTKPYRLDITHALKSGNNTVEITVANTWANRIMGDEVFLREKNDNEKIWTNARYRLKEQKPVKSGILGEVRVVRTSPPAPLRKRGEEDGG